MKPFIMFVFVGLLVAWRLFSAGIFSTPSPPQGSTEVQEDVNMKGSRFYTKSGKLAAWIDENDKTVFAPGCDVRSQVKDLSDDRIEIKVEYFCKEESI